MSKQSFAFLFFDFVLKEILIYEVKKSTILKTKDFILQENVIDILVDNFKRNVTRKKFKKIVKSELNPLAEEVQREYLSLLFKEYISVIDSEIVEKSKIKAQESKYQEAIYLLENNLGISSKRITHDNSHIDYHIDSTIYKKDYERVQRALGDFSEGMSDLREAILTGKLKLDDSTDYITEHEYLVYVVYNEVWNFMSHMGYAISYFDTPRKYISNIDKGIGHLRRAILDIYDGLIVETQEVNLDYLKIRNQKLESLGCNQKIEDLSTLLRDHYLKYKD